MLHPRDIIAKKRDGQSLDRSEIYFWIQGVLDGSFSDYQSSALLMAIFIRGMDPREREELTAAMRDSGKSLALGHLAGRKVDKHSTGGVGDKVSLVLAPWVASCGVVVPMMSGRGLGHTGGTLDKLASISGFRTDLEEESLLGQLEKIGVVLIGQTRDLAPADRVLYALRDVTATVESIPLICASIMSKKLAEGLDGLVLDVKFGRGAFMQEKSEARELGTAMVDLGQRLGVETKALLTRMDSPLGRCVGHALEVEESLACLRGEGPQDLMEVTQALAAEMLMIGRVANSRGDADRLLSHRLQSGAALRKFGEIISAQGGDTSVIGDPARLPKAAIMEEVVFTSGEVAWIKSVDARHIAEAVLQLGGGRKKVSDAIDLAVGISGLRQCGERVEPGEPIARIHASSRENLEAISQLVHGAFTYSANPVQRQTLVEEIIP